MTIRDKAASPSNCGGVYDGRNGDVWLPILIWACGGASVNQVFACHVRRGCPHAALIPIYWDLASTTVAHDRPEGRAVLKIAMSSYGVLALLLSEQS